MKTIQTILLMLIFTTVTTFIYFPALAEEVQETKKQTIAILDFDEGDGISSNEVLLITDIFRDIITKTDKFNVMAQDKMKKIIITKAFNETGFCSTTACDVQKGKILQVQLLLAGQIGKLGSTYQIIVRLIDVEEGKILSSERAKATSLDNIDTTLEQLASKLIGTKETPIAPIITPSGQPLVTAKGTGTLDIKTNPAGVQIIIDGDEKGYTPKTITLQEGKHNLILNKQGYVPGSQIINIEKAKKTDLSIELVIQTGSIVIKTIPEGASVYLDGNYNGQTSSEGFRIKGLPIGSHRIKVEKEKYSSDEKDINIKFGVEETINVILKGKSGGIYITSAPTEAEIYIDGTYKGLTPMKISDLPPTTYKVVVKKQGYNDWSKSVTVAPDDVASETVMMIAGTGKVPEKADGGGSAWIWVVVGVLVIGGGAGVYFALAGGKGPSGMSVSTAGTPLEMTW